MEKDRIFGNGYSLPKMLIMGKEFNSGDPQAYLSSFATGRKSILVFKGALA